MAGKYKRTLGKKYRPRKNKKITRRSKYKRPSRSMNKGDTTISVINPGKDKVIRVQKSLPLNQSYTNGGVTKGVNFQFAATAVNWGQVMIFDPAGAQGNHAGTVALSSSTLSPAAITEWVAYKLLYTQYRVRKITLKFNAGSLLGQTLDEVPITIFIRYQKEWIANPGTAGQITLGTMAEQRNIVKKTFTSANPDFQYSFYPKVAKLSDAGGTGVSADGRSLKSMGFQSVNTPVDLWGIQLYVNWPGSAANVQALLQMDVSYDIEFKTQS